MRLLRISYSAIGLNLMVSEYVLVIKLKVFIMNSREILTQHAVHPNKNELILSPATLRTVARSMNSEEELLSIAPDEICDYLEENSIQSLTITHHSLGDDEVVKIAQFTSLQSLNLSYGDDDPTKTFLKAITDEAAFALANHPTITHLNLRNNYVGDLGAKALFTSTTLIDLNLSYNQIRGENSCFENLYKNTTLKSLNLFYNYISSENAAIDIAKNTSIQKLNLGCNDFTDAGVVALSQSPCPKINLINGTMAKKPGGNGGFSTLLSQSAISFFKNRNIKQSEIKHQENKENRVKNSRMAKV